MPAPAAPRARTGPRCSCACTRAGPSGDGYKIEIIDMTRRRGGRHQVGDAPDQGPQRLWLAEDRIGRAPAGAHLALRQQCAPAHHLRPRLGLSGRSTTTIEIDINESDCRIDTYRAVRRRRPARQHHRLRRCASPTFRPASWSPCQSERSQHKNRATAWKMLRARLYEAELEKREAEGRAPRRRRRPRSAGATRSAPTCCSPISW